MRIPVIPSTSTVSAPTSEPVYTIGNQSYTSEQLKAILPTESDIDHLVTALAKSGGRGFKLRASIDDALTRRAVAQAKVAQGTMAVTAAGFGGVGARKLGEKASYVGEVKVPLYRNGAQVTDNECIMTPNGLRPHGRDTSSVRSDDGLWFTTAAVMGDPATDVFSEKDPYNIDGFRVWSGLSAHLASLSDDEFAFVVDAINAELSIFRSELGFPRYKVTTVRGGDWALEELKVGNQELGFDLGTRASQQSTIDSRLIEMLRGPAGIVAKQYAVYNASGFYGAPCAE